MHSAAPRPTRALNARSTLTLPSSMVRLKDVLQQEGFFDRPDQRLLLFTEFKDTLDYLVRRLMSWGFRVGAIHGGMKPGSRWHTRLGRSSQEVIRARCQSCSRAQQVRDSRHYRR